MALVGTVSGSNGTSNTAVTGTLVIANVATNFPAIATDAILFVSGNIGGNSKTVIGGDLRVSGSSYFTDIDVTGHGAVIVQPYGTTAGNTGEVRFKELAANGGNYTALKAADSIAANLALTLPSTIGANGNVLQTNGSGVTSFVDASSVVTGALSLVSINASGDLTGSNILSNGDVDVRGGDITTNQATFNLITGSATTINFGGSASTRINMGNSGGQVWISGSTKFPQGLSGSLTQLTDGTSYIIAGTNVTVATGSNGSVTVNAFTANIFAGIFGDGADGDVTIAAGTTTVTRDMNYNSLTVNNGGTLKVNGNRIYVKGTLQVDAGGAINDDGSAATGITGGGSLASRNFLGGAAGGGANGRNTTGIGANGGGSGGNSSTNANNANPAGGNGGSAGGANGGGTAGGAAPTSPLQRFPNNIIPFGGRFTGGSFAGGGGGGAGGADITAGAASSGGGGGGAGIVVIFAKTLTNNGSITANGGKGGDATSAGGIAGGGGGGGGGLVGIVTTSTTVGTVTANGGGTGAGAGGGAAGSPGVVGTTHTIILG